MEIISKASEWNESGKCKATFLYREINSTYPPAVNSSIKQLRKTEIEHSIRQQGKDNINFLETLKTNNIYVNTF